jgi:hypothetical protein
MGIHEIQNLGEDLADTGHVRHAGLLLRGSLTARENFGGLVAVPQIKLWSSNGDHIWSDQALEHSTRNGREAAVEVHLGKVIGFGQS